MVTSKSVLDEVIASIAKGQANYQKFIIIITTDFRCELKCDHMIGTTDAAAIDLISDAIIQYCSQHYILGYTAQYIDKLLNVLNFIFAEILIQIHLLNMDIGHK